MSDRLVSILVADDHAIVRRGLKAILESISGWRVCADVDNGRAAVDFAVSQRPDIAILDYSLPILNGLEATRQIRQAGTNTEILIYTMHNDDEIIHEVLKAGARGYVLKSAEDSELIAGVESLLRKKPYYSKRVSESLLDSCLNDEETVPSRRLTARERELIQLVAEGNTNKRIATQWSVSIKTVEAHRTSAMKKLNVRTAAELTRYAVRNRIIEP